MMLSSKNVRIGALVAMLVGTLACAEDDGETTEVVTSEYGEICVRRAEPPVEPERVPWEECENDPGHVYTHPHYINQKAGYRAPPVGGKVNLANGTSARPANTTVSPVPNSGGFGTHTAVIGG